MKLDTHVHSLYSGYSTIPGLNRLMRESYNTPRAIYRRAKSRGMHLVTITDHDRIDGVLTIAHFDDVIVGCEVTAMFPDSDVRVHLGVLNITEAQHREIDRLRANIYDLLRYLRQERIFVSLNHVASRVNGRITGQHLAAMLPWIDGFETRNGSRLAIQNRTAERLAADHGKVHIGGSDAHTLRGVGLTWIEAPFAHSRQAFIDELRAGRIRPGGRHGSSLTMASDVLRMTSSLYCEHGRALIEKPWRWRRHVMAACLALGAPLVTVPLVMSVLHFILEARFNAFLARDISRENLRRELEWI